MTDDVTQAAPEAPTVEETKATPSTEPHTPPVTGDNPVLAKVIDALVSALKRVREIFG